MHLRQWRLAEVAGLLPQLNLGDTPEGQLIGGRPLEDPLAIQLQYNAIAGVFSYWQGGPHVALPAKSALSPPQPVWLYPMA